MKGHTNATGADRLPPLVPANWSAAQRLKAQPIIDGPRGALLAPFIPLLRSPELMGHVQRMGEFLRYRNSLGLALTELAILITAQHWSQAVEWAIHAPIALRAGISQVSIDAIERGAEPGDLDPAAKALYTFATELLRTQAVSDASYTQALAHFGEHGIMDLTACIGYYALLAMVMNVARTPVPVAPA